MQQKKGQKFLSLGLICIATLAIVFAVICWGANPCIWETKYVSKEMYGGDAYTGIQNAAADTANNIKYLDLNLQYAAEFFAESMGYVFCIVGLLLLCIGISKAINAFKKEVPTIISNTQDTAINVKQEN